MAKLWNKPKRIEVYQKETREKVGEFVADDMESHLSLATFYLDGKDVGWFNEKFCYYKYFDLEEAEK